MPRTLYGVVAELSQLMVNHEQAYYYIIIEPRLILLVIIKPALSTKTSVSRVLLKQYCTATD
ncbi:hypothetical protein RHO15_03325 [Utexia brackfieldae]|uniref:hypothetical protein n=1 Tax=Utexia brackfieldae TaxID=3074108 RepID=UPI00370DC8AC